MGERGKNRELLEIGEIILTDDDLGSRIIFIITFLGIFIVLVGMIYAESPELMAAQPQYRDVSIPEELEAFEVPVYSYQSFNITWTAEGSFTQDFDFDDHTTPFTYRFTAWNTTNDYSYDPVVLFIQWDSYPWSGHGLDFWQEDTNYDTNLAFATMDTIYNETGELIFSVKTEDTQQLSFLCSFRWNETTYSTPSEALHNEGMLVYVGLTWEQEMSALNAWSIITMVLFFQLPDIHPALSLIIGLPIWVSISYIIFTIITKIVEMFPFT